MSEFDSFTASGNHILLGQALTYHLEEYYELWMKVQEYGKFVDKNPEEERFQNFFSIFGFSIASIRLVINLISCVYIEGLINFYLSSKTDKEQFSKIERKTLLNKWTTIPKLFIPNYEFPKEEQLFKDLFNLISWRNSIVHSKPLFVIGNKRIHEGNSYKINSDEHKFAIQNAFLSERLVKHLWKFDQSSVIFLMTRRIDDDLYQYLVRTKTNG